MLLLVATAISAMLIPFSASAAVILRVTQGPLEAPEGTSGNPGLFNVANIGSTTATITGIFFQMLSPIKGELDDKATNIDLIRPNPTQADPLILSPDTNFNIRFSWDAVDNIKDGDVDFGQWQALFGLNIANVPTEFVAATLQVNDPETPIPAAFPLFATGLGGIGLLGWCKKVFVAKPSKRRVST
jgi:hypothetical protein